MFFSLRLMNSKLHRMQFCQSTNDKSIELIKGRKTHFGYELVNLFANYAFVT